MADLENILRGLVQPTSLTVRSGEELVGAVESTITKDDERLKEKGKEPPRRKPRLSALPHEEASFPDVAPLSVLHAFARSISLDGQGSARGLAEHWGCLKYALALASETPEKLLLLSPEGRSTRQQHRRTQAHELGAAFGAFTAECVLRRRFRGHRVSIVPADIALLAGWTLTGARYRPRFLAEVWKPGEPGSVLPIACKGHHGRASNSHAQFASASIHLEAVHIGPWNRTPGLLFSTELSTKGPIVVHALRADGDGGALPAAGARVNVPLWDRPLDPFIIRPADGGLPEEAFSGFHVRTRDSGWFRQVLARVDAAGLTAFTGARSATARYLTRRQGQKDYTGQEHAAISSVRDTRQTLLGTRCVGTEHVFRINSQRVEAFTGVAEDLVEHLDNGRVDRYRREAHARFAGEPFAMWDERWRGAVSVRPDGSVLAIRRLRACTHASHDEE
ncbi:hypothetical protein DFP74_5095 [Nocardiopsis sp. Huas11]|uniref:hypothetical protein n=1 Tax=Nocardiopsis sp. Huas11 TaxID=2183912 RepID=UPI000EADCBCA|nr:hypothetical protein [Nocardiopsis sp. Huas11]RKS09360.1 hypothetical protein DFP74_5095 [Nocardiopsis sp. Huas11]